MPIKLGQLKIYIKFKCGEKFDKLNSVEEERKSVPGPGSGPGHPADQSIGKLFYFIPSVLFNFKYYLISK